MTFWFQWGYHKIFTTPFFSQLTSVWFGISLFTSSQQIHWITSDSNPVNKWTLLFCLKLSLHIPCPKPFHRGASSEWCSGRLLGFLLCAPSFLKPNQSNHWPLHTSQVHHLLSAKLAYSIAVMCCWCTSPFVSSPVQMLSCELFLNPKNPQWQKTECLPLKWIMSWAGSILSALSCTVNEYATKSLAFYFIWICCLETSLSTWLSKVF